MSTSPLYQIVRRAGEHIRLSVRCREYAGSIAVRVEEDGHDKRSVRKTNANGGASSDCVKNWNLTQIALSQTSRCILINVEKNVLPLFVLNIYVEDAILNKFNDNDLIANEAARRKSDEEVSTKPQYTSTTTAAEFTKTAKTLALNVDKFSTSQCLSRVKNNSDESQTKKGGLLPFVTKLSTFRQPDVPQASFTSKSEKTGEIAPGEAKPSLGTESPADGSMKDGSFTKVTDLLTDLNAQGSVAEKTVASGITTADQLPAEVPGKENVHLKAEGKAESTSQTPLENLASSQESLKDQSTPMERMPTGEPELLTELKDCAVVTKKGSLKDVRSLIESTQMQVKDYADYQYGDHRTKALLQKYKALKLKEIEYHHAQIKKHRKQLLELMFKTPYQKQKDPAKRP